MRLWLWFLLACGPRLPAMPRDGGPAWIEVRSSHFTVWSDGDAERVRELAQQMEYMRAVVYSVAFPFMAPDGVTFVVAFRDSRESAVFTPPDSVAFTTSHSSIAQPLFVIPLDLARAAPIVAHELTHAISLNAIQHQPRWFGEGLATYFETIAFYDQQQSVDVGNPPDQIRHVLAARGLLSAATLFTCKRCQEDSAFYASSWVLIAYLRSTHGKEFDAYLRALAELQPDDAWHQVFPTLTPAQLDQDVRVWLTSGGLHVSHYTLEATVWSVSERTLTDADVYAVRALLGSLRRSTRDEALANVAAALALDPTNVMAAGVGYDLRRTKMPAEMARKLVTAHPEDWLAWAALQAALPDGDPEGDAAEAKMCAIVLQNPALGVYHACARKYAH